MVLGGVNIDKQEEMDQTIPVIQTVVHEDYRQSPSALYSDIGWSNLLFKYSKYKFGNNYLRQLCEMSL